MSHEELTSMAMDVVSFLHTKDYEGDEIDLILKEAIEANKKISRNMEE